MFMVFLNYKNEDMHEAFTLSIARVNGAVEEFCTVKCSR